ncbi:hypothetical protein [Sphingomonas nostoxanthinifaciens]|uniref:hypothetical protein n=1 Tax=Sphingomonas nostoxanthinifaciens TaxID=2872652 RepID=UPI001CC212E4|nr:hypothetical protein [Sphingomonas nostoxanthinifaciens]UAK24467.1 hypothetical protein K8P63_19515 [Sphingomonas nostoxanthinifaciens]
MRAIVTILAIVVVIAIVAVATGFVNLHGNSGQLPSVAVSGGKLPTVNADVGSVDVGTKTTKVDVPKVETVKKDVAVPTVTVNKPQ